MDNKNKTSSADAKMDFKQCDVIDVSEMATELERENKKLEIHLETLEKKNSFALEELDKWKKERACAIQPELKLLEDIKPLLDEVVATKHMFDMAARKLESINRARDVEELNVEFKNLDKIPAEERDSAKKRILEATHEMTSKCLQNKVEVLQVKEEVEKTKKNLKGLKSRLEEKYKKNLSGLSNREANRVIDQFVRDNVDLKKIVEMKY